MAYTSEIDKLEARWRENPKGRNFAPLADAYRKAGLIDNAIDLCQSGLKLHPDYVSAHIVYARCLIDKKDDAGAGGVFKKVLELDGENIIALRGLAELAERTGRFSEEVEWLTRLLNADPMNGDAAEALARAKGKAAATATEAPTAAMDKPAFVVEHTSAPAETAMSPDVETFDGTINVNPEAHAAAKAEGLEVQEDVELNPQQIEQVEVEGLARTQYEGSGMFKLDTPQAPESGPELLDDAPAVDLPLFLPDDVPAPTPPPAPAVTRAPPSPPAPAPPRAARPAAALSDDDGAADTATLSQAEPVLTETMAELYLKQGHQADALRVYQALLAQRPGDARLTAKIEQLSGGGRKGSGVSAQAFLQGIWSGRSAKSEPAAPPPVEHSTLAAAFDAAGLVPTPGEPTQPATDHISLDAVFGDDAARRSTSADGEPPAPGAPGAPAAPAGGEGFSFDQFFAGSNQAAGGTGAAPGSPRTPGGSRSSGAGRAQRPPEDEAEADQFQQWLKKLKS